MGLEERKKHALKWVNARRKEGGAKATSRLPKGYEGDGLLCPVAKALECVGVYCVSWWGEDEVVLEDRESRELYFKDPIVHDFLYDFDAGEYPELAIGKTVVTVKRPGERKATPL